MIAEHFINDCIGGDRKAIAELYRLCYVSTFSICLRYQSDHHEAESVFNVAFLKVLKNLNTYNQEYSFKSWVKRIMINANIDEFRKNRRVKELITYREISDSDNDHFDFYPDRHNSFSSEELEEMIRSLPPMSRKVFNLYAIDDYTHKEIGSMLGISDGTSKWHLSSARKKLKELIQSELQRRKIVGYEE